jgi:protein-histidine pros-kinase
MPRRLAVKDIVILGSLLSGGFSLAMAGIGLWLLWQSALDRLTLSRPGAVVAMVFLGVMGVILSGLYAFLGWQNLEFQQREQQRAAELEAALRSLQDSDYKFRSVIENMIDAVYIKDLEGRFLLMNPAGYAGLGLTPEQVLGKCTAEFLGPETARRFQENDQKVLSAKEAKTFEERLVLRDGQEHVFMTTKSPYLSPEGQIIGIIAIAHDITERQRGEEALRASEARFRGILEAAPDASLLVNSEGRVVMANAQAERMFGYPRDVLVGMGVEQLMPERFREVHVAHRGRYYAHPHARPMGVGMDLYGLRRDGNEFPVEISLSPLETPEGMVIIASLRDVTERKRVLREMAQRTAELQKSRELNQLKDHFLSSLSHEMKTPLSLICGYAELLEEKYPDERLLEGILKGSQRLNEHISNMLDYSAMVSGTLPLYKTEVNLAEQLQNVRAAHEESMRLKGLRFLSEVDSETPPIQGDPRRISQMIGELLSNAIKFTPEGGSLGVRIRPEAGKVRIEVWDTGPGILESDRQKIWSAFTQLEVGDTLRKGGLGLGLTIVSKLAELHGGTVELESEVGKGSRFIITLPIEDSAHPNLRVTMLAEPQEQPSSGSQNSR